MATPAPSNVGRSAATLLRPARIRCLVGVVVAVVGLQLAVHGGDPGDYHHRVLELHASRVDAVATRADATDDYAALSPLARNIVDRCRRTGDGRVALPGSRAPPPEFGYSDATRRYVVENGTGAVEVRTWGSGREGVGRTLVGALLVVPTGIATLLAGLIADNSRRKRRALLAGMVPVAALALVPVAGLAVETALSLLGFLAFGGAAWVATGSPPGKADAES